MGGFVGDLDSLRFRKGLRFDDDFIARFYFLEEKVSIFIVDYFERLFFVLLFIVS